MTDGHEFRVFVHALLSYRAGTEHRITKIIEYFRKANLVLILACLTLLTYKGVNATVIYTLVWTAIFYVLIWIASDRVEYKVWYRRSLIKVIMLPDIELAFDTPSWQVDLVVAVADHDRENMLGGELSKYLNTVLQTYERVTDINTP